MSSKLTSYPGRNSIKDQKNSDTQIGTTEQSIAKSKIESPQESEHLSISNGSLSCDLESAKDSDLQQIITKLQTVLKKHQGERQLIIIQDFPDPDALSSAWAYQLIAATYKIECEILYAG